MEDALFKECPFCKEKIRKEAVKCRFCGEWLEQQASPPPAKPVTENVQITAQVIELTRPNSETLPVHEASEGLAA